MIRWAEQFEVDEKASAGVAAGRIAQVTIHLADRLHHRLLIPLEHFVDRRLGLFIQRLDLRFSVEPAQQPFKAGQRHHIGRHFVRSELVAEIRRALHGKRERDKAIQIQILRTQLPVLEPLANLGPGFQLAAGQILHDGSPNRMVIRRINLRIVPPGMKGAHHRKHRQVSVELARLGCASQDDSPKEGKFTKVTKQIAVPRLVYRGR